MSLFWQLVDPKLRRVLTSFQNAPQKEFHLQELSHQSKVPLASVFRIVKRLVKLGILKVVVHGKLKMYKLSSEQEGELTMLGGKI
ncbi:helix-turn-helix domain-containing protein [Candidatus Woesearchaeota archaeon]|nr:helix-turn-helix domain-containing protein [Candidatus Woesearchaeota archaeon]